MYKLSNNKCFFLNIFSVSLLLFGISELPPLFVALYLEENTAAMPLGISAAVCIISGLIIRKLFNMNASYVRSRMNYMTTIMTWIILIGAASFVFYFALAGIGWADAVLQSAACLTTTGISNPAGIVFPQSMQLWRSLLNWLGGVGIILTSICWLSNWGFSAKSIAAVELPCEDALKTTVKHRSTYKQIITVYMFLTVLQFIMLLIAGMDPFNSVLTALSNISTSGVPNINNGIITGLSLPLKSIITLFAFLGSINVSFFILLFFQKYKIKGLFTEVHIYTYRILLTAVFVAVVITISGVSAFGTSLADAMMQTVSFLSTSGFKAAESANWPFICQALIMLQVFIGGCAAATSGGIKTARIEIAFKTIRLGLFKQIHPRADRPIKVNNSTISSDQLVRANLYIALFMVIYILGAFFMSVDNVHCTVLDALNYSQAMISNTGTPVLQTEITGSAFEFSAFAKIVMSIEMLAGRLEIYPLLMILSPSFWKTDTGL